MKCWILRYLYKILTKNYFFILYFNLTLKCLFVKDLLYVNIKIKLCFYFNALIFFLSLAIIIYIKKKIF